MELCKPKVDDAVEEIVGLVRRDEQRRLVRLQMRHKKIFALALRPSFYEFGAENVRVADVSKK